MKFAKVAHRIGVSIVELDQVWFRRFSTAVLSSSKPRHACRHRALAHLHIAPPLFDTIVVNTCVHVNVSLAHTLLHALAVFSLTHPSTPSDHFIYFIELPKVRPDSGVCLAFCRHLAHVATEIL